MRKKPRNKTARRTRRLRSEQLESRRMLKNYYISEPSDPGDNSTNVVTLTGAILDANANYSSEQNYIYFQLPITAGGIINLEDELPIITAQKMEIVGTNDANIDGLRVKIIGRTSPSGFDGFQYNGAANSSVIGKFVVRDLEMQSFSGSAIKVNSLSSNDQVQIDNNWLHHTNSSGVVISDSPFGPTGKVEITDNYLYSNGAHGISLGGGITGVAPVDSTVITGNKIGISPTNALASNNSYAIALATGAEGVMIGSRTTVATATTFSNDIYSASSTAILAGVSGAAIHHIFVGGNNVVNQAGAAMSIDEGAHDITVVNNIIKITNGGRGIVLTDDAGVGVRIVGNDFRNTPTLPIDLLGDSAANLNDEGDDDGGPNRGLNTPIVNLAEAAIVNGKWRIPIDIEVDSPGEYRVDFYRFEVGNQWNYRRQGIEQNIFQISAAEAGVPARKYIYAATNVLLTNDKFGVVLTGNTGANANSTSEMSYYTPLVNNAQSAPGLPGDFSRDGFVNSADYTVYRDQLLSYVVPYSGADGNGNGIVDAADYSVWKANYGRTLGTAWTVSEALLDAADFTGDGYVDNDDAELWYSSLGQSIDLRADANDDGVIDAADLLIWQAGFEHASLSFSMLLTSSAFDASLLPRITRGTNDLPLTLAGVAPTVDGVSIGSSTTGQVDDLSTIAGTGDQLRSIATELPDSITVFFSEEVIVLKDALSLHNLDGTAPASVIDFTYNVSARSATWVFDQPLMDGRHLIRLSDDVHDLELDALDGEFWNPWSLSDSMGGIFPTGDGDAGGDFRFHFTVLTNDTNHDNIDGSTNYTNWTSTEPGAIYVSTTTDEFDGNLAFGDVSLREAVNYANNAGVPITVYVPEGMHLLTLVGSEPSPNVAVNDLDILGDVTIRGYGPGVSHIRVGWAEGSPDGANDRQFTVMGGGATLNLAGLTLSNGVSWVAGQTLYASPGSVVSITDSAIAQQLATYNGISVQVHSSDLTVRRSVFTNNKNSYASGAAIDVYGTSSAPSTLTIGESLFALNDYYDYYGNPGTTYNVRVNQYVNKINEGNNLIDDAGGGFFDTTPGIGDYLGAPDYVVTSIADEFNHANDGFSLSLREAVDLANQPSGPNVIWLPAWRFTLTRDRQTYGGGSPTDTDVAFGDLDIKGPLTIRGIADRTRIEWKPGVVDAVFDLLGDYSDDGLVNAADYTVRVDQNGSGSGTPVDWEVYTADGDDDGDVDTADHTVWSTYYGSSLDLFDVDVL
jgi:hypothetical protein